MNPYLHFEQMQQSSLVDAVGEIFKYSPCQPENEKKDRKENI